jgi:cytochrome c peroxidase
MYKSLSVIILVSTIVVTLINACKKNTVEPTNSNYEIKYPSYFGSPVTTKNPITQNGATLGRYLFYEKKLSKDNSISCGSCHIQKYAFSDTAQFSKGVNGLIGSRNAMALSNLYWQKKFFWDGREETLEDQALKPITDSHEMQETLENVVEKLKTDAKYPALFKEAFGSTEIITDKIAIAISQFERTMVSANSRYDQYLNGKLTANSSEKNGMALFFTHPDPSSGLRGGNCGDCHSGKLTYSVEFRNNGLDDENTLIDFGFYNVTKNAFDKGKFKIPSLRNIALTAPYMHDGRFKSLKEVLDHYNEHIKQSNFLDPLISNASNQLNGTSLMLTATEKQDIINFLKMLSDESFTTDEALSNPNK